MRTRLHLVAALVVAGAGTLDAATLKDETVAAWDRYVEATEQRIATELAAAGDPFLVLDRGDDAARVRRAIRAGEIPIADGESRDARGGAIDIPSGAVHHWRGSIFVPDLTLNEVLAVVRRPMAPEDLQDDVVAARILEQDGDRMTVFLKLRRTKVVTVHYNTEHVITYRRHDARRASSRSVATRIAELVDADSDTERERPIGDDRGFLWRLNSYWRYLEVDGGVIIECESISLSRSIPAVVRWMVSPLAAGAARESLTRTLVSLSDRLGRHASRRAAGP